MTFDMVEILFFRVSTWKGFTIRPVTAAQPWRTGADWPVGFSYEIPADWEPGFYDIRVRDVIPVIGHGTPAIRVAETGNGIDVAVTVTSTRCGAFGNAGVTIVTSDCQLCITQVSSMATGGRCGIVTLGAVVERGAPGIGDCRAATVIVTGSGCTVGKGG